MRYFFAAFLALGWLAGCQTPGNFATPDSQWTTYNGQLRFSSPEQALIGETIVAVQPPSQFQMNYTAGPGFPLLDLRVNATNARAQGVLARGRWQGAPETAPEKLQSAVALAEVFQRLAPGTDRLQGRTWSAQAVWKNGSLTALDIRFSGSGERFQFVFAPRR